MNKIAAYIHLRRRANNIRRKGFLRDYDNPLDYLMEVFNDIDLLYSLCTVGSFLDYIDISG